MTEVQFRREFARAKYLTPDEVRFALTLTEGHCGIRVYRTARDEIRLSRQAKGAPETVEVFILRGRTPGGPTIKRAPKTTMTPAEYRNRGSERDIQKGVCQLLDLVGIPHSVTDAGLTVRDGRVVGRSVTTDGWPDVTACVSLQVPDAMMDSPWPLHDTVAELVRAVEHLFEMHECDTWQYEKFLAAKTVAQEWLQRPMVQIGQLLAVETKTAQGKLRQSQTVCLVKLEQSGARICVAKNLEDVARTLIAAGIKHQVLTALCGEVNL